MKVTLSVILFAVLATGAAAQPAPPPGSGLVAYITQSPDVPPEIKAGYLPDEGPEPSCTLADWLTAPTSPTPESLREIARRFTAACTLPVSDIEPEMASRTLGSRPLAIEVQGAVMTALVRAPGPTAPQLCCSLQRRMQRLGDSDIWALRYRLEDIDHAMLTFSSPGGDALSRYVLYRGPAAPSAPPSAAALKGRVTQDTLYSQALGETRKLFIYVPPGTPPPGGWPALFVADGDVVLQDARLVEALVDAGAMSPIVLIGTESGQDGIVEDRSALGLTDIRSADYLPDYPGAKDRFAQHMTFLAEELAAYARAKYGIATDPGKLAVTGFSNGGQLAFEAGVRRPDVFGAAIPRSAGWKPVAANPDASRPRARFFASAGTYEPNFLRSTRASATALQAAGYQVEFTPYVAGHMADQWDVALAKALPQVFPAGR